MEFYCSYLDRYNLNRSDTDFTARYLTTSADIITSGQIKLNNYGNGTFNKAAIISNASGLTFEGLISTDDFNGVKLPVTLTWERWLFARWIAT